MDGWTKDEAHSVHRPPPRQHGNDGVCFQASCPCPSSCFLSLQRLQRPVVRRPCNRPPLLGCVAPGEVLAFSFIRGGGGVPAGLEVA